MRQRRQPHSHGVPVPDSRFVGVDFAANQVSAGLRDVEAIGLRQRRAEADEHRGHR